MKRLYTSLLISAFTLLISAQNSFFTLDDVVVGGANYATFKPKTLNQIKWVDKNNLSYLKNDSTLVLRSLKGKEKTLLTLEGLRTLAPDFQSKKFPNHQWHDGETLELSLPQKHLFYSIKTNKHWAISYPQQAQHTDLNYATKRLAYTLDNNLYYATPENEMITVTQDVDTGIVNGQSVHRNEFGITKGTFWSPNGKLIAFYRKDESMVSDYPLVDITARTAQVKYIKYPMAGMASHEVSVGIYNPTTASIVYLQTGAPKNRYFTNIAWSPDETQLYIAEVNRAQDTMTFNCYHVSECVPGAHCRQ